MKIFCAYASTAPTVGDIFQAVANDFKKTPKEVKIWPENDVVGRPLIDPILENINNSDFVVVDITKVNFNVAFEAGYAIAKNKRLQLVLNSGVMNDARQLAIIGIYDTLGYEKYENSNQLGRLIREFETKEPLIVDYKKDNKNPIYIVELPKKSDAQTRIISRVKKARLRYRSFNAAEHIRLSANAAIQHVASSSGVIVPIASAQMEGADIHNIRAAFVAGLATGLKRPLLLIQDYDGPAPLDVRDVVKSYRQPEDIDDLIADFSAEVIDEMQSVSQSKSETRTPLSDLVLGDPMAENEMTTLANYYLDTEEYLRVSRGEANMVVGRKGMGKTALFIHLRDNTRNDVRNVVVDLKPEGYQLKKLREDVLEILSEGSVEHLVVAFWEYLLYMEIANKLIEKDAKRNSYDQDVNKLYRELIETQSAIKIAEEGDFSERLLVLVDEILGKIKEFELKKGSENRLTTANITEIIHSHALPALRERVAAYLKTKKSLWVLFDNLDKGWPVQGIDSTDANILKCLIDAGKKIKRDLTKRGIPTQSVVFVRNDVYQILMQNTADFGKEISVRLDWSDRDLLREMVKRRLTSAQNVDFEYVWESFFCRLYKGVYSFDYIIDRCLMRPRNLIKIMFHARGYAINMRHQTVTEGDLEKALKTYSNDVLEEADEELTDIEPISRGLIYHFIGESALYSRKELLDFIHKALSGKATKEQSEKIVEYLLYFGFFGVKTPENDPRYIYDFSYNMQLLTTWISKNESSAAYYLNPAFWPALEIKE